MGDHLCSSELGVYLVFSYDFSGFLGDTLFPQLTACIQSVLSVESGMGGGVSSAEPPHAGLVP